MKHYLLSIFLALWSVRLRFTSQLKLRFAVVNLKFLVRARVLHHALTERIRLVSAVTGAVHASSVFMGMYSRTGVEES